MAKKYFVYMMTNRKDGVLYTGITNDITRRVYEHKKKLIPGFTNRYNLIKLVFVEETCDVNASKQIKGWLRKKKIGLIELQNPDWKDMSEG